MSIELYPSVAKVKRNGVYQNLPGFVQPNGDNDAQAMIANAETSTTAQFSHPKGSYFRLNGTLYEATVDIKVNDIIAVGTNCKVSVLGDDIYEQYKFLYENMIAETQPVNKNYKFNETGGINTNGTENTSSTTTRTGYIFLPKNWIFTYSGLRLATSMNVFSVYNSSYEYQSSVSRGGSGAGTPLSGSYYATDDCYIRVATRTTNLGTANIYITSPLYEQCNPITKFVDPVNGDDNNDGNSITRPLATIATALSQTIGKPTILRLAKANYNEPIMSVYEADRPSIKIYGNGATIIDNEVGIRLTYCEIYDLTVDLTNIKSNPDYTGTSCFFVRNGYCKLIRCKAKNAPYMGFRLDGSKSLLIDCISDGAGVDGFNAHDNTNYRSEGTFINCEGYDSGDDGLSFHENGIIRIIGGKYYNNTQAGIAPHHNCNCEIYNAYIGNNGTSGIEIEYGALADGEEYNDPLPTAILIGNIFDSNTGNAVTADHFIVKACANGAYNNGADSIVNDSGSTIKIFSLISS